VHDRTEEIYYILAGEAVVRMNGEERRVRAGDLVTTPIGARHAIRNEAERDMVFFVVEVFPGKGPAKPAAVFTVADRPSPVDLTEFFTGPWKTFQEMALAPGEGVGEHTRPGSAVVLLVVDGEAAVTVDDETYLGGPGLCVGLPDTAARAVHNPSTDRPLRLIATEVGLT
jgi:mannose-6-phosphate isomerase-like protein (cupin superfamily)